MKFKNMLKNAFRSYRKNWFWSLLLSLLLSFLFLLLVNLYLLLSKMDLYYETVILLDTYDTSIISMVNMSDTILPFGFDDWVQSEEERGMDEYQKNFSQELLDSRQAGYINQLRKGYFYPDKNYLHFEIKEYNKFNHIVILAGKYLDFAGIGANFSNGQVYAYVSEDNADLVGTEFEFSGQYIPSDGTRYEFDGEEIPIISTLDYTMPVDISAYSSAISEEHYQEDFRDYDYNTIFLATNSLKTLYRLFPNTSFFISEFDIFNPTEELLHEYNLDYSARSGDVGNFVELGELFRKFDRTRDPLQLRIETLVIASGSLIIFIMLLVNIFQNIKDQHKEFRIHMQFGANDSFIFSWILHYVIFYFTPSLIFIPIFLYFSLPIVLTTTNIVIGLILYLVFVFVISLIAFRRFKSQERI